MYLEHINIVASRELIEIEKTFYLDLLELKEGFRPKFNSPGYWLYSGEMALVHLTINDDDEIRGHTGNLDHIAFHTTKFTNIEHKLIQKKIEYSTVKLTELGMTQLFFKSPLGIRIEVNFIYK